MSDGFYEQRLIREQVVQLTGNRFLAGYADDEAQFKALMNNGISSAKAFDLQANIALSAEQVAQLTRDIVWLVAQEVMVPAQYVSAGKLIQATTKTKALVPKVYVSVKASDLNSNGQLLSEGVNNFV